MATGRKVVQVGDAEVIVRPVRWADWQAVKEALARLLGSRLVPEVISLAVKLSDAGEDLGASAGTVAQWYGAKSVELGEGIAALLTDAIRNLGGLSETLVRGCIDPAAAELLRDVTAAEFFDLAEAAIEASDIPGLIGREKNFWTGVLSAATAGNTSPT